jgi:hypothetical protein
VSYKVNCDPDESVDGVRRFISLNDRATPISSRCGAERERGKQGEMGETPAEQTGPVEDTPLLCVHLPETQIAQQQSSTKPH